MTCTVMNDAPPEADLYLRFRSCLTCSLLTDIAAVNVSNRSAQVI